MPKANWILFDFGGCLDSDGIHSRILFFDQFKKHNMLTNSEDIYHFQNAYTYSDRKVIQEGLIKNFSLFEMNKLMCSLIINKLKTEKLKTEEVASAITETQAYYLNRNKNILIELSKKYNLGIISNFSGNLTTILEEFDLLEQFKFVIDSFHVGYEKPNLAIFKLAIEKCHDSPENIFFIGDNPDRDIEPARKMGMQTILISKIIKNTVADYNISSLIELLNLF